MVAGLYNGKGSVGTIFSKVKIYVFCLFFFSYILTINYIMQLLFLIILANLCMTRDYDSECCEKHC